MATPEDPRWLAALVERAAVLPEPELRAHWQTVTPWLPTALRYELAGILMDVEVEIACQRES